MSDLVKSVKKIVMQLATRGEIIQDVMVIHIILNVLPSSYETFVQTIITHDQLPSFDKLTSKLLLSIKQDEKPRHLEEVVMENYFSKPTEVDLNHILAIKKEVLMDLEDDAVNLQEARTKQMITKIWELLRSCGGSRTSTSGQWATNGICK